MEWIREWCGLLCFGALGCCAVQLLAPATGTGKIFRLVVMTFFLCCAVMPILKFGTEISLPVTFLPSEVVEEQLNDRVTAQLKKQVENTVVALTEEALANRDVTAEKITVYTDTSENGSIYIKQVVIQVDKQKVPIAGMVGETLEKQWETTVVVCTEGT